MIIVMQQDHFSNMVITFFSPEAITESLLSNMGEWERWQNKFLSGILL